MLPAQPNRSLIDGLAVLQALASSDEPIGSRELARRLGLETTRANRLLKTLAHLGIADQDADRRYRAGPGMHVLAAQALHGSGLVHRGLHALADLRREEDLVVALVCRWRDRCSYLICSMPGTSLAEGIGRVAWFPARRSSAGLVIMADDPELADDPDLAETRARGYGRLPNDDEVSIAVAVGRPAYAGIAVAGKIDAKREQALLPRLRAAAALLEE
jgi:DNA-binding IclR family transcriptional regulator